MTEPTKSPNSSLPLTVPATSARRRLTIAVLLFPILLLIMVFSQHVLLQRLPTYSVSLVSSTFKTIFRSHAPNFVTLVPSTFKTPKPQSHPPSLNIRQTNLPPNPPTTHLLIGVDDRPSLGESIRVHRPFLLHEGHPTFPFYNHNLSCATFDQRRPVLPLHNCTTYLEAQDWTQTGLHFNSMFRYSINNEIPQPGKCSPDSVLVLLLLPRDINVCHALMRLSFGFNILQRQVHNPGYLAIPKITHVVIVAPDSHTREKFTNVGDYRLADNFHLGLVRDLFINKNPLPVTIASSFPHIYSANGNILCFSAGVILHSHANRFALPDAMMGDSMAYGNAPSLPPPLSSDALALRNHIYFPNKPPAMRNKVLYVHRHNRERSWTSDGEKKFRELLRNVTEEEGVDLHIFEGHSPYPTFREQVSYYADASVVVGFHGAGLAPCVFSPRNASVVEIEPETHRSGLFRSLELSGLIYEVVHLSKGTGRRGRYSSSDLDNKDYRELEMVLKQRIRYGQSVVDEPPK